MHKVARNLEALSPPFHQALTRDKMKIRLLSLYTGQKTLPKELVLFFKFSICLCVEDLCDLDISINTRPKIVHLIVIYQ